MLMTLLTALLVGVLKNGIDVSKMMLRFCLPLSGEFVPLLQACLRYDTKHTLLLVLRGLLGRAVECELLFVTFAVPILCC